MMKYTLAAILLTAALFQAEAATYYIDYANGSDGNAGTSKAAPWKRAPGMNGFSASYGHSSGDRFIFKGGVAWPVDCFQWKITVGGSGNSSRDYYGSDPTWYAGGSFRRPLFDFQHREVGPGWMQAAGVLVEGCDNITFEGLEFANHRAPLAINGVGLWGSTTICLSNCGNFTLNNCVVRDWSMPTPIPYGASGGGGIVRVNSGSNILVTRSTFHQEGVSVRTGSACWNIGEVSYSEIHHTASAILSAQSVHHNHIHHLEDPTDAGAHSNVMLCLGGLSAYNNLIHDISSIAQVIFVGPGFYGTPGQDWIYNNVVYNVAQPCVAIDTNGKNAQDAGSHIFNNTLVGSYGNGHCIRVGYRANGSFPLLEAKNNHFITRSVPVLKDNPSFGGAMVTVYAEARNVHHTPDEAAAFSYDVSNGYAPRDGSKPTVTAGGVDLSSIFTVDINGNPRGRAWQVGAYHYGGASSTLPPTGADGGDVPSVPVTPTEPTEPAEPTVPTEPTTPTPPSTPESDQMLANYSFESGFSGWNATGNQDIVSHEPYEASHAVSLVAFNRGQSTPNAVLSQAISTTPGQQYAVNFDVGVLAYNRNDQVLQVVATGNGALLSSAVTVTGIGGGRVQWSSQSFTFVADSPTTTLTFEDISAVTDSLDMLLDHVRVTPVGSQPSGLLNGGFERDYEGWTQSGYQVVRHSADGFVASEGNEMVVFNSGDMPANGILSQSLATTPGQRYALSFDVGTFAYAQDEQRLSMSAAGASGALLSDTISVWGSSGGMTQWTSRSYSFVADSTLTTLIFQDVSPATRSIDLLLDNVRVAPEN